MENNYKKTGYFFLIIIPLVVIGFYPTYFGLYPEFNEKIDFLMHGHFFMSALWIVVLIAQPFLILNKKYQWHRLLGRATYVIFPIWVLSFIPMINNVIQKGVYKNLVFPVGIMVLLIILYVLAIKNRKTTATHMRYMIASAVVLIDPTIGRLTFNILKDDLIGMPITFLIMNLVLAGLIWMDKKNGKDYQPYLVALACFLSYNIAFFIVFLS
jgi:hypothetical protein